jgi:Na+-transporting NADH:ubiquinone oxidoreductase subunit NqrB
MMPRSPHLHLPLGAHLRLPADPRWLQIAFLALFLTLGLGARDFPSWHAPFIFATALATQAVLMRATGALAAGFLSPIITSFGLTLLLRTDDPRLAVLAAFCSIASKFFLRVRGRHFFNPANLGLCAVMIASDHAWCSPAQWGESALFLLWFCALGLMVAHRAFRSDVSLAFLGAFAALRLLRVVLLGQRLAVLEHQILSGSLLLFTFFMISDPKTTPRTRAGRIVFACAVAALAHALQFVWFVRNPLLWALFACAPLTPLFDAITGALARSRENSSWNPPPQIASVQHAPLAPFAGPR